MFTLHTSFKTLLLMGGGGGGDKNRNRKYCKYQGGKTLKTFVPIKCKNSASAGKKH